jgi:hypothetical protein
MAQRPGSLGWVERVSITSRNAPALVMTLRRNFAQLLGVPQRLRTAARSKLGCRFSLGRVNRNSIVVGEVPKGHTVLSRAVLIFADREFVCGLCRRVGPSSKFRTCSPGGVLRRICFLAELLPVLDRRMRRRLAAPRPTPEPCRGVLRPDPSQFRPLVVVASFGDTTGSPIAKRA